MRRFASPGLAHARFPGTRPRSGEGGPPIRDTPVGEPGTTTFTINWLTDVDPLAQCNDGSPAAYYYAKGTGSSADLWVVYLEGSMFCWGQASCSGASPRAASG